MMKKRMMVALIPAILLAMTLCASANELILPASLTDIEEEAFFGDTSLDEVVLPEGITRIESKAFAGSSVTRIYLPESLAYIAPDAFDQCGPVSGYGPDRTYASEFFDAAEGLSFEHTPRYIALLIGNGDYNGDGDITDPGDLKGPHFDVNAFEPTLAGLNPAWEVTSLTDLSASGLLAAIDNAFGDSRPYDTCLFYYSGHGSAGGYLSCVDNWHNVAPQDLAERLNQAAKGKVIVLLDCCYGGSMIAEDGTPVLAKGRSAADPLAAFNAAVISAFSGYTLQPESSVIPEGITLRTGELRQEKFCVLTACAKDQTSAELTSSLGYSYGLMTYELIKALGCTYPDGMYGGSFTGDKTPEDSRLTLAEARTYITYRVELRKAYKQNELETNHDQLYEDWKTNWNESHYFNGKYYARYDGDDGFFEAKYDFYYHAYDQITSTFGSDSFVLFER